MLRNRENPLPVKSKTADGGQIGLIKIAIIPPRIVRFRSNLVWSLTTWQPIHYKRSRWRG